MELKTFPTTINRYDGPIVFNNVDASCLDTTMPKMVDKNGHTALLLDDAHSEHFVACDECNNWGEDTGTMVYERNSKFHRGEIRVGSIKKNDMGEYTFYLAPRISLTRAEVKEIKEALIPDYIRYKADSAEYDRLHDMYYIQDKQTLHVLFKSYD